MHVWVSHPVDSTWSSTKPLRLASTGQRARTQSPMPSDAARPESEWVAAWFSAPTAATASAALTLPSDEPSSIRPVSPGTQSQDTSSYKSTRAGVLSLSPR